MFRNSAVWRTISEPLKLPTSRQRADIQGLRAVAVILVALNHAGVGFLKGGYVGVDVFFVLSGYLITGLLIGDAAKHRRVSISEFYVRRARRILPAATLTLVATLVASYSILNIIRAKQTITDIIWSAVFSANIHFSNIGTDYFASDRPASPVQHFWSLAVEEQFYIVWPTVVGLVLFGIYRIRKQKSLDPPRLTTRALRLLSVVVAVVFLISLAWSIHQTAADRTAAYFSTFARAWELALGAGLATCTLQLSKLPPTVRLVGGWIGLGAIAAAAVLFTADTPFPGVAALLPTVGAALVIAVGVREGQPRYAAGRLLSVRPMRYVGDLSYTFYLWHWPLLVLAAAQHGAPLSLDVKLGLLAIALAVSIVTYTFFENPIHRSKWQPRAENDTLFKAWILSAWVLLPALVIGVGGYYRQKIDTTIMNAQTAQTAAQDAQAAQARAAAAKLNGLSAAKRRQLANRALAAQEASLHLTGALPMVNAAAAAATANRKLPSNLNPSPAAGDLANYISPIAPSCSPVGAASTSNICSVGSGSKTLVVFGDSHTQMWLPVIERFAGQLGYTVRPVMKSACSPRFWGGEANPPPGCTAWLPWAVNQMKAIHPDVVLVATAYMPTAPGPSSTATQVQAAFASLIPKLRKSAKRVVFLGDLYGQKDVPTDCLLRKGATQGSCSTPRDLERINYYRGVASQVTGLGASFIDDTGWFCAKDICPMVIGNTVAYADKDHVTSTYADELTSIFETRFKQALQSSKHG